MHVSEGIFPELEAMGLSIPVPKPAPKKRGRPRKNPLPDPNAPRKRRGRLPEKVRELSYILLFEVSIIKKDDSGSSQQCRVRRIDLYYSRMIQISRLKGVLCEKISFTSYWG